MSALPNTASGHAPSFDDSEASAKKKNGTASIGGDARKTAVAEEEEFAGRYLDAEAILSIDDIPTKTVIVPEWHTSIILQGLNGAERDKYLSTISYTDKRGRNVVDQKEADARLIVLSAKTPNGDPLFNIYQVKRLQAKSGVVIGRLARMVRDISGLAGNDEDDEEERRNALD